MAISDKLQDLIDIKQDIKEAIENKGADLTGVDFGGYAEKIDVTCCCGTYTSTV